MNRFGKLLPVLPALPALPAFLALLGLSAAGTALASVRVVDDEVFFSLRAPGAREVFLVGDFNNWNPTVESMPKSGDVFEISLYLVEGSYRYKFVVDGKWMNDPDNPGKDPARGSPLVLVEKPAGLALRTEIIEEVEKTPAVQPSGMYIGNFRWEDESESDQLIDLYVDVEREKLRSNVILRTVESSWDFGRPQIDVTVNGGFIETKTGGIRLRAFEWDTVWTSNDPLRLVGEVGIYDYSAGYGRKGATAEYRMSEAIAFRGLYADDTGPQQTTPPAVDPSAMAAFAGGSRADTVLYRYGDWTGGSDLLGFETYLDAHDFQLGYTRRHNRGLHRGLLSEIQRMDSLMAQTVFETRENFYASVYWLRLKRVLGARAVFGIGRGEARINKLNRGEGVDSVTVAVRRTVSVDEETRLLTSNRYVAGVDYPVGGVDLSARWDRTSFAYHSGVLGGADAVASRSTLRARYQRARWSVEGVARHTDLDYDNAPSDLVLDSPVRNFWLDGRDNFEIADMAAFDLDSYLDVGLTARWNPPAPQPAAADTRAQGLWWLPTSARVSAGITSEGFLRTTVYTRLRLTLEKIIRGGWVVQADGRTASYGRTIDDNFFSGYIEAGYRTNRLDVNIGYGFDPVVFDFVVNEYRDIGRSEHLREALVGGVRRGFSESLLKRLASQEKALEDVHSIKLECILYF